MNERGFIMSIGGLAGGVAALAVDVLYLAAIDQQGVTPPGGRVPFVAGWIATSGILAVVGAFVRSPARRALILGLAAAMLGTLGIPAVFSVGVPLLLCAALVAIGALRAGVLTDVPVWLATVAPFALIVASVFGLILGFEMTEPGR